MRKLDREGYSACDIRPDGGFVAVTEPRDRHVLTHLGTLVCPDVPHWPRITPVGPVKIAVQGESRTREWVGGQDWLIHREACGAPSPVLYDRTGLLRISDCAGGSEGYHHEAPDGRLVWGSEVTVRAGSELRETTDLGDGLYVGQGQWGGAWVQLPDGYRLLGAGSAMAIRAVRSGDDVAVCWYEPDAPHVKSATAHFRWYTIDELRALPCVATTRPPVTYAPIVPPSKPMWMLFYTGWTGRRVPSRFNPSLPANGYIHVIKPAPGEEAPAWLDVFDKDERLIFRYVSGEPDGDRASLETRARAAAGPVPVIGYATRQMLAGGVPDVDVVGFECYQLADESDRTFAARILSYAESAERLGRRYGVIAHVHQSNKHLTQDLRRPVPFVSGIGGRAACEFIAVFHGPGGRADGWDYASEEVRADWRAVFAGIPGVPAVAAPLPAEPPQEHKPDTDTPAPPVVAPPAPPAETEEPDPMFTTKHFLDAGETMVLGQYLISDDGTMELWLHEGDGNLVLYRRVDGHLEQAWTPWIGGRGINTLVMQTGGRLVAFGVRGEECWATESTPVPGSLLIVRGAPHFDVVLAHAGIVSWLRPVFEPKPKPKPKPSPRPSTGGWSLFDAIRSLFGRKPKAQAPVPNPSVPPAPVDPPVVEVPAPPAIVLPPLRHRSIEAVREIVMSGRHAYLLRQHHPEAFMDAVLAEVDDPRWGLHLRPNGRHGGGVIAFNVPAPPGAAPYRIYDIVAGATSPSPAPGWLDQTATMEPGSRFAPVRRDQVPPVLTLPRVRVDGLRFVTDRGVFDWRGGTAFDLPSRIRILGDLRYADWMAETGFTLARVVPASRFRTQRTLADGVRDLPRALAELAVRGLYAEVVIGVDTGQYGMSREDMRIYTRDMLDICREYSNTLVEVGNELSHGTQAAFLRDAAFLAELVAMCREAGVTCSAGSSHGGEGLLWTGGDFATHHADRSVAPEVNVAAMADLQDMHDLPVVDDEPLGTHEIAQPGRRTNDPGYAEVQARAARTQGLAGTTFHCEAGLTANVDVLGPVQREAARRFIAELRAW